MMYEYWLACKNSISGKKKRKLREYFGDARSVYYIEETLLKDSGILNTKEMSEILNGRCKETDLRERYQKLENGSIRFIPWFSMEYPRKLLAISDPPYALFVKGRLPEEGRVSVAIVGARVCTPYGEKYAMEYGEALAAADVQIISGMARGIDSMGQRGALDAGGDTFGVLGCGVDICYPRENMGLYHDLEKKGGLLSEQPPGTLPLPHFFPLRNRLISGLSDAILVMEAKAKSGSLITADLALDQGKEVYALPGPVNSALSQGCHGLIRQGAGILTTPSELLEELHVLSVQKNVIRRQNEKKLETPENIVYSCLGLFPKSVDELAKETGFLSRELFTLLISLELKGMIREISKNYYVKI